MVRRETLAGEVWGSGISLESDASQSHGQEEGDEGRLSGHRHAWRCVSEIQFRGAATGYEDKGSTHQGEE